MAELSYPVQAVLPAQRPQSPAGQRAGAKWERVQKGERWQKQQLQRTEPLAEAAVQQRGQQPDAAFTASSTESSEQAQETESKTWFYSASLHFGPDPHAKEALFGPGAWLTNKSSVGGLIFLKWEIMGVSKHQH